MVFPSHLRGSPRATWRLLRSLATGLALSVYWAGAAAQVQEPVTSPKAPQAQASVETCTALLERRLFTPPHQDRRGILRVQHCLVEKKFPPGAIDGYLGPETNAALERYWLSLDAPRPNPAAKSDGLGVSYMLTAADLKALQVGDGVLAQLKKLKGKPFESEDDFLTAMEDAIKGAAGALEPFMQEALRHAQVTPSYRLTGEDFKQLRVDGVPDDQLAKLADLQDLPYPTLEAIEAAIDKKLPQPRKDAGATPQPAKEPGVAAEAEKSPGTATPPADSAPEPSHAEEIKDQIREVTTYELTEESLKVLADSPAFGKDIPSLLLGAVRLQGIDFPTQSLFRTALEDELKLKPEDKTLMAAELDAMVRQARKTHAFDPDAAINWQDNGCGCVLDSLSGTIYGFYPYWQAGASQSVDFSLLSRIGYYAVKMDDQGNLASSYHWRPDRAQFINAAHRHGTQVDLVIYRNEWNKWRQDILNGDFTGIDDMTDKIVQAISTKLDNTFFNRNLAWFSLGASGTPSMGDGVTLFFEDYPTDDASSEYLVRFLQKLKEKLRQTNKDYYLNLVVPQEAFNTGIYSIKYLRRLIPDQSHFETDYYANDYVDLFLVLMGEPTKQNKKALRQTLENLFNVSEEYLGMQRRNLLRKIVPVVMPDGHDPKQFGDDVIYFEDNFGGIGFWPMPAITAGDPKKVDPAPNKVTQMALAGLVHDYLMDYAVRPSAFANFVCVHKWGFRLAFDALAFLLIGYGVLAIFMCSLRIFWEKYSWYFLALVVLLAGLALAILFYDPFYTDVARGNGPLILVLMANLLYVGWLLFNRKRRRQQP